MKLFHTFTAILVFFFACKETTKNNSVLNNSTTNNMEKGSIYAFKVKDLSGNEFDFSSLKGK